MWIGELTMALLFAVSHSQSSILLQCVAALLQSAVVVLSLSSCVIFLQLMLFCCVIVDMVLVVWFCAVLLQLRGLTDLTVCS